MAQRYIYLSDELNAKLKQEDNVSKLIQNLLNDYYKSQTEGEMSIADIDKLIAIEKLKLQIEGLKNGKTNA